jgi:dolichyl-diphosphooligosaccharide---protein glycosyltransferase
LKKIVLLASPFLRKHITRGKEILRKLGRFELHKRHLLIVIVLVIAFSTTFIMRSYPIKYGFYLNEFDPYFNYRATKYIVDNGVEAYWNWHDTMSWYPEGRDIAKTSQSGLHIVTAFLYKIFGLGTSLLDFTIILPVILGSLTSIVFFALVRTIGGGGGSTTAGLFAALLFAFNPIIIQRGNLGWFKSEAFGLFFGVMALYLLASAIQYSKELKNSSREEGQNNKKYAIIILKSAVAGIIVGLASASWGGATYLVIPISLFFVALPFFRMTDTKILLYIATIFTIFTILTSFAFPRPPVPFVFGFSTSGAPLVGPGIMLVFSIIFMAGAHFFYRFSSIHLSREKARKILFFLLIAFFVVILSMNFVGVLRHISDFRYVSVINPFVSPMNPLFQSVAEHARPTLLDYLSNYSILLLYAGFGIWAALKQRNQMSIFALIIGITGVYVSITLVRLLVFSSIGIIILAAIGLYYITKIFLDTRKPSSETEIEPEKTQKSNKTKTAKKKFELLFSISNYMRDGRLVKIAYAILTVLILLFPMVYPRDLNWLSSADIPPTILTDGTDSILEHNDWINSLHWISNYTPKDSVIAAWWDYGYWITTIGNRATLADNANINETRVGTIAKMFMEEPKDGAKIAQDLKANYILIFVVAQRVSVNGTSYYTLGYGGYEDKLYWFIRIGGLGNVSEYLEADEFTPKPTFWNTTLIGRLIPFTLQGYASFENKQTLTTNNNSDIILQTYKPGAIALYSKEIKYPENGRDDYGLPPPQQPFSLIYSSDSFTKDNQDRISAVLIYKINNMTYFS